MIAKVSFREGDKLFEVTKARKHHCCYACQGDILPQSQYYSIIIGGGLGAFKFPQRCHIECKGAYLEKVRRSREL